MAVFGKRPLAPGETMAPAAAPAAPAAAAPPASPPPPAGQGQPQFPWSGDAAHMACDGAFMNLLRGLGVPINQNGRIHAETYVAAAGAVAGFAAQKALFEAAPPVPGVNINVATLASGAEYWFGDSLNMALTGNGQRDFEFLWPHAVGGSLAAGMGMDQIPAIEHLFAQVARRLGSPGEGFPSTSAQPQLSCQDLLRRCWPVALACLTGTITEGGRNGSLAAPTRWWPCITALVAARAIIQVKQVLPPATALVIVMETAILASKVMERSLMGRAA